MWIVGVTLVDAGVAVVVFVARGDAVVRAKESGRVVQGRAEVVVKAATKDPIAVQGKHPQRKRLHAPE